MVQRWGIQTSVWVEQSWVVAFGHLHQHYGVHWGTMHPCPWPLVAVAVLDPSQRLVLSFFSARMSEGSLDKWTRLFGHLVDVFSSFRTQQLDLPVPVAQRRWSLSLFVQRRRTLSVPVAGHVSIKWHLPELMDPNSS